MLTVTATLFLLLILALHVRGFRSLPVTQQPSIKPNGISVVIPFRNESHNLKNLINSLAVQKVEIPFEIILVNDRSTDSYLSVFNDVVKQFPELTMYIVDNQFDSELNLTSKQQAIDTGVEHSRFEMVVFTDADMIFSPIWLESLLAHFDIQKSPFVFGRTSIIAGTGLLNFVQKIQLDFLFATAHLFARAGIDTSCMGNNIAISKELYRQIGGQKGIGYTIVEDKKLLSAVKRLRISPVPVDPFVASAFTYAVDSPKTFLHQMIRWLRGGATESLQILGIVVLLGFEIVTVGMMITGTVSPLCVVMTVAGIVATWGLYIREFAKITPIQRGIQLPLFLIIIAIESLILLPSLFLIAPNWKGSSLKSKRKRSC